MTKRTVFVGVDNHGVNPVLKSCQEKKPSGTPTIYFIPKFLVDRYLSGNASIGEVFDFIKRQEEVRHLPREFYFSPIVKN